MIGESLQRSAGLKRSQTAFLTALLLSTGCASVISGRHADVAINSEPENARVCIRNQKGEMVAQATTPAVVTLKRGDGFLKSAKYTATFEKPGYQTAQAEIRSTLNPWIFGNVLVGGVVGLAVDPYTGAMWRPTPSKIQQDLHPLDQPQVVPANHESEAFPSAVIDQQ